MRYVFNGNYVLGLGKNMYIASGSKIYYSGLNVVNETIWIPGTLSQSFIVHVSNKIIITDNNISSTDQSKTRLWPIENEIIILTLFKEGNLFNTWWNPVIKEGPENADGKRYCLKVTLLKWERVFYLGKQVKDRRKFTRIYNWILEFLRISWSNRLNFKTKMFSCVVLSTTNLLKYRGK